MKISIRWALIFGCLVAIWGTQLITLTSSYVSSEHVLLGHARDIMKNISGLTMEQSENHLAMAHGAANLTKRLMSSNVVSSDAEQAAVLEKYFYDQLAIYPHFEGIYLGTPDGDFFDVRRCDQYFAGGLRTKIIHRKNGKRVVDLIWRDNHNNIVSRETDSDDTYDPRVRPWYKKALKKKSIVWTDPYIFYTSQRLGITIAGPAYTPDGALKGVVGVDINIEQLSTFIGKLKIGKNGRAFMINNNGNVVAFPDLEKLKVREKDVSEGSRIVKITELDDPLSRKAFEVLGHDFGEGEQIVLESSRFGMFSYMGRTYHAMFTPFSDPDWPWIIAVYLPQDDYLGSIKDNRRFNLIVTFVISALFTVIGLLLAKSLIRPISELEKEALAVRNRDYDTEFNTKTAFKEIQETTDSFSLMKQAVRKSEEKYRGIFENIQDIYYEAKLDGTMLEVSPSAAKIFSLSREELIGLNAYDFFESSDERKLMLSELYEKGKVSDYEVRFKRESGDVMTCSTTSFLLKDAEGNPQKIIGSLRDISKRKETQRELEIHRTQLEELVENRTADLLAANEKLTAEIQQRTQTEKELRKSEEKYRTILENIENGYFEIDTEGRFTFFNEAMKHILGYSKNDLFNMNSRSIVYDGDESRVAGFFNKIFTSGMPDEISGMKIVRKDGSKIDIELSASLIVDKSDIPVGFRGIAKDISQRIHADMEKKKLQETYNKIQRLKGIGTLAGGVAHDFNNLLMGIQGNVSLMMMNMEENDPDYIRARNIEKCVKGGADLTRQLLGFARGGKYNIQPLNANSIVQSSALMFGRTRKELNIHENYQADIWTIKVDQGQFEQVLLNLFINAWQAMPRGGDLFLSTENVFVGEKMAESFDLTPGSYVKITIRDTGVGMDQETRERAFEPFFTTKERGRGTGLGLASVYGIIKNHDGIVSFDTAPGKGTVFYIYLPASSEEEMAGEESEVSGSILKGTEMILVVDDEEVVLNVSRPMLEGLGYTVLQASGGKKALEIFEVMKGDIDLVILDMIMPDVGGGEVFDRIRELRPDMKVLLSSGYSIKGQAASIMERGCNGFIQKPFDIKVLSQKIRAVLGSDIKDDSPV